MNVKTYETAPYMTIFVSNLVTRFVMAPCQQSYKAFQICYQRHLDGLWHAWIERITVCVYQCWAKSLAIQIRIDSNHDLPIKWFDLIDLEGNFSASDLIWLIWKEIFQQVIWFDWFGQSVWFDLNSSKSIQINSFLSCNREVDD